MQHYDDSEAKKTACAVPDHSMHGKVQKDLDTEDVRGLVIVNHLVIWGFPCADDCGV